MDEVVAPPAELAALAARADLATDRHRPGWGRLARGGSALTAGYGSASPERP